MLKFPSRIAKMPRRRKKIAIYNDLKKELGVFIGSPNSPLLRAEITRIFIKKIGIEAWLLIKPHSAIKNITIDYQIGEFDK